MLREHVPLDLARMQTFRKQYDNEWGENQYEATFSPRVMTR